jgi:hypothetical protein
LGDCGSISAAAGTVDAVRNRDISTDTVVRSIIFRVE